MRVRGVPLCPTRSSIRWAEPIMCSRVADGIVHLFVPKPGFGQSDQEPHLLQGGWQMAGDTALMASRRPATPP